MWLNNLWWTGDSWDFENRPNLLKNFVVISNRIVDLNIKEFNDKITKELLKKDDWISSFKRLDFDNTNDSSNKNNKVEENLSSIDWSFEDIWTIEKDILRIITNRLNEIQEKINSYIFTSNNNISQLKEQITNLENQIENENKKIENLKKINQYISDMLKYIKSFKNKIKSNP